jgi:hypothetical protein
MAEDAVRSETVSPAVLPPICDLQGDLHKLQGEARHCNVYKPCVGYQDEGNFVAERSLVSAVPELSSFRGSFLFRPPLNKERRMN